MFMQCKGCISIKSTQSLRLIDAVQHQLTGPLPRCANRPDLSTPGHHLINKSQIIKVYFSSMTITLFLTPASTFRSLWMILVAVAMLAVVVKDTKLLLWCHRASQHSSDTHLPHRRTAGFKREVQYNVLPLVRFIKGSF